MIFGTHTKLKYVKNSQSQQARLSNQSYPKESTREPQLSKKSTPKGRYSLNDIETHFIEPHMMEV
jgi:hypothetical protein